MPRSIKTYSMSDDTERLDFAIRDQSRITRTGQAHRHEFFQMRLDVAGQTHHHIGADRRLLSPGSVSFVLPYRMHRGGRREDSQFYVINFHHRFLRPEMSVDPLCVESLPLDRAPELAPFVFQHLIDFTLDGEDLAIARDACRQMMLQSERRGFFSVDLIRANLLRLIGTVCQRYDSQLSQFAVSTVSPGGRDALAHVSRYIAAHLAQQISLADVAAAADVSPSQVTRLLKRETGKTFMQLVTERRLQKAQELLANTTMRIGDIAEASGFEDNAYFARRFRQFFRLSPRAYRSTLTRS